MDCVLKINSNNIFVSDCYLYPTDGYNPLYGLEIGYCSCATISNCDIIGFKYRDIQFLSANHCNIENCTIANSYKGIETMFYDTHHIYIYNCEIYNCGWDDSIPSAGIELSTNDNCVSNCNIYNNYYGVDIYYANRNQVTNCNLYDNIYGNYIHGYDPSRLSTKNKILGNNIYNNDLGIYLINAQENIIHHNNFENNSDYNAVDSGLYNSWDNGSEGNYWYDYTGQDNDGDGIGDTPYFIYQNGADYYPLMDIFNPGLLPPEKPIISGPSSTVQWVEYFYEALSIDPNYECVFYLFDWGDGTDSGWVGPFGHEVNGTASHVWENYGTYNVKVKAMDIFGLESIWSDLLQVNVIQNYQPEQPVLIGPSEGIAGYTLNFTICSNDDDGEQLRYWISWGDDSEWTDYFNSGEVVNLSHSWGKHYPVSEWIPTEKIFEIKAKAQDIKGADSEYVTKLVVIKNNKPSPPLIEGESKVRIRKPYHIIVSSIDPDNHTVCFEVKWGDGDQVYATTLVPSGQRTSIEKSQSYTTLGTFIIEARAIDIYGASSNWSSFPITVARSRDRTFPFFDFFSSNPLLSLFIRYFGKILNILANLYEN